MAQTVEEIAEILDNIKAEADRNADSFSKLLTSINNKVELLANDTEADDLIKVYLAEIKTTISERHSIVLDEFEKIEASFTNLINEQANFIKTPEIREMFDIFSNNMKSIAQELFNQKETLGQFEQKFTKFSNDKTDKTDVIKSVETIKKDIEVINKGFETSISEINDNIQSIFKNLIVMDPTAHNDIVRRELENVYLATNAILSSLHVVDQKNDELAHMMGNFITKEDFLQSQEKLNNLLEKSDNINNRFDSVAQKSDIDSIIYKSSEISEKINNLPLREDLKYFAEKTSVISEQISALPHQKELDILSDKLDTVAQKDELSLVAQKTDELSQKFDTLPQQEDLADMYKSLHEFSEILDNLRNNLMSASESNSLTIREELDKLSKILSAVVTENDFAGFRHDLADFVQKIIDNSSSLNDNLNLNKTVLEDLITKVENFDIHQDLQTISNALDGLQETEKNSAEKLETNITCLSDKLNQSTDLLLEKANTNSDRLSTGIDNLSNLVYEVKNEFSQTALDNAGTINAGIKNLGSTVLEMQGDFSQTAMENAEKITSAIDVVGNNLSDTGNKLMQKATENSEKISSAIENIESKIIDNNTQLTQKITEHSETICSEVKSIEDKIEETRNEFSQKSADNAEIICNNITTLSDKLILTQETFSNIASANVKDITSQIENIAEQINNNHIELLENCDNGDKFNAINTNIEFLKETVTSSQAANEASLSEKLLALRDMINNSDIAQDEKFLSLREYLNTFAEKFEKISDEAETKIKNSLIEITDLKTDVEHISDMFTEWNYGQENRDSKLVGMISSELGELGVSITTLQDSVQAGVHQELSNTSDVIEKQINDLIGFIEKLKEELIDKEPDFDFETAFKEFKDKINAVKQEINLINTDIVDALNTKAEAIMFEIAPLKNVFENITNLSEKIDTGVEKTITAQEQAINTATENIKKEFTENFDKIYAEICKPQDYSKLSADIKNSVSDNIRKNTEELKTLLSVALNNDDITWAINDLKDDISDKITRIYDAQKAFNILDEKANNIVGHNTKISELLDALNQKVDVLAMTDDFSIELQDGVDEIKDLISSQRTLIENSNSDEKLSEIEKCLQNLMQSIDNIPTTDFDEMRNDIIASILSVFEQISFIEEAEDIKDFVEEKTDEINKNITEVKQQLIQITNNDGYSYTLQDVESDIAKLRLALNEFSTSSSRDDFSEITNEIHKIVTSVEDLQNSLTQEQVSDLKTDFEKLSDDVLSISSRTNKLLLTSDESYNALNRGLNDFSSVIYKLEERINYLDNKEIAERIENKLDNVKNIVTDSANSDKVMRQALMYMGEWIDSTSDSIENLCEQSEKVTDVRAMLEQLQNKIPEQANLLTQIADKFEEQQERLDRVELKLEKILNAIDNIDDTKLTKKVDKLDKQLAKMSANIEKLASYVDE